MEPRLAAVRHGRHHMLFDRHRSRLALLAEAAGRLVGAHDARQLVRDLFDLIAARLRLDAVVNYDLVENAGDHGRSEEHTSELQSLMRISYAVFCLKKKHIKDISIISHSGEPEYSKHKLA